MYSFSDITVVNIDGRVGNYELAINALVHSQAQLPGSKALLLTPKLPNNLIASVSHKTIPNLGYWEYGVFVTHLLHQFIDTEFALIVQDDGWIVDGGNWSDEYFTYDYVGAPTHFAKITQNNNVFYGRQYSWTPLLKNSDAQVQIVMNGGFSLRSQRLMSAPAQYNLPFRLDSIALNQLGSSVSMISLKDDHLEDVQLCINLRNELESVGVKFASTNLARNFSFEHLDPVIHQNLNLLSVLGHHSKLRKLISLSPLTIEFQFPESELHRIVGESEVRQVFLSKGYRVTFIK
jgi:hypothetical protein